MKKTRCALCYAVLAVCFALLLAVSVGTGSAALSPHEILRILLLREGAGTAAYNVLLKIRLPRVLAAAVMGGTLSVSGFLLQTFFRNPIAGPYVLGVSSGAKLAVGAVMIFGMKLWGCVPFGAVMTAAFVGAMLCASFVMIVSRKIHSMAMLLVVGMMIGNVCSAATDFFVTFAKESDIANLTSWSMGSFSAVSWGNLRICLAVIAVCLLLCLLLAKPIGAYQFGEHYAASMGVNVRRFRAALIGLSCLLAACVTALVGPISFVGIAVPYDKKAARHGQTDGCSARLFPAGRRILYGMRLDRPNGVFANGAGHQHGNGVFRRAGRYRDGTQAGRRTPVKPTLELDNLSVGYGRRVLLKDLCASILPGQILTLIGPNGAGKSTILKTISHHLACMGGVVRIGGENIERMDSCELAKRLSVVLTERVRPELMTCYDVAASGRYPYTGRFGMLTALDRDVIAQSLALVRVKELADKPFARVSDGQRQRVMIARALCQQPRVLVLDEPTSFLDIRYKIELSAILLHLAREQGVTIVMSLHEIDLAARVSDLVMGIGTHGVEMFGAPEAVFTEENITQLYGISSGVYDALSGSMELPRAEGAPYAFVLGGMGKATTVYRRLTREGTPFATGILAENDMDIPAARHLAARILTTAPFAPPSEAVLTEARQTLLNCGALLIPDGLEAHAWDDELICFAQEHCVEVRHA